MWAASRPGPGWPPILSMMETCRRVKMPVREYLAWVLPGLEDVQVQKVNQYTPLAWAASHG